MKLWCFYFAQPYGGAALECRMYFGEEEDINEVSRKMRQVDDTYVYFEEFTMDHLTNT